MAVVMTLLKVLIVLLVLALVIRLAAETLIGYIERHGHDGL